MRVPEATLIRYNGSRAAYIAKRRAELADMQSKPPKSGDSKEKKDKHAADVAALQATIADNE